jgi:hypothetical protein
VSVTQGSVTGPAAPRNLRVKKNGQ